MQVFVDYCDLALNGRFGPFNRNTSASELTTLLGPSDPETTYPGCYSYGNFGFEFFPEAVANRVMRMRTCICIPHPEHFSVSYASWKVYRKRFWHKLEHDYPDSRFDCHVGDLVQGATINELEKNYLSDAVAFELLDEPEKPRSLGFLLPSGVSMWFSNYGSENTYSLYLLDTMDPWGPDIRENHVVSRCG